MKLFRNKVTMLAKQGGQTQRLFSHETARSRSHEAGEANLFFYVGTLGISFVLCVRLQLFRRICKNSQTRNNYP